MPRAIWSGSISFGMVTIPVKLFGATESRDISFNLLHATCGSKLQQKRWCPTDDVEVPWNETARGYEFAKGQYVVLTDEDFEKLPLPSRHVIDLTAFSVLHAYVGGVYEWTGFEDPLTDEQIAALSHESARIATTPVALDPEDDLLFAALATDGRLSYAELAGVTGWSESRVARRVEALRSAGALYFDLEIATELLGHPVSALLWLGVAPADIAHVGESLAREPETAFTAVVTGPANLMVAVTCRDTAHLYRFLTDRVGALPVRTLETSTVLRRVKQAGSLMDGPRLTDPEPPPVRGR